MVAAMTWVKDVRTWEDFGSNSWNKALSTAIGDKPSPLWIERHSIPALIRNDLDEKYPDVPLKDIAPILGALRMIKSDLEIRVMKEARCHCRCYDGGRHDSLGEGLPEYESALAVINAGSRKAAEFLTAGVGSDLFHP